MWIYTDNKNIVNLHTMEIIYIADAENFPFVEKIELKAFVVSGMTSDHTPVVLRSFDTREEADEYVKQLYDKLNA